VVGVRRESSEEGERVGEGAWTREREMQVMHCRISHLLIDIPSNTSTVLQILR
jgi:hypothetical protein